MKPMKRKGKKDGTPLFHKCSVLGCGCSKAYLYYRSDSQAGGVYLCDECAGEMADLIHHPDNTFDANRGESRELTAEELKEQEELRKQHLIAEFSQNLDSLSEDEIAGIMKKIEEFHPKITQNSDGVFIYGDEIHITGLLQNIGNPEVDGKFTAEQVEEFKKNNPEFFEKIKNMSIKSYVAELIGDGSAENPWRIAPAPVTEAESQEIKDETPTKPTARTPKKE